MLDAYILLADGSWATLAAVLRWGHAVQVYASRGGARRRARAFVGHAARIVVA